jgi:hypothetical protein
MKTQRVWNVQATVVSMVQLEACHDNFNSIYTSVAHTEAWNYKRRLFLEQRASSRRSYSSRPTSLISNVSCRTTTQYVWLMHRFPVTRCENNGVIIKL